MSGGLLVQMCLTECDRKTPIMRRPWPTRGYCAVEEKKTNKKFERTSEFAVS